MQPGSELASIGGNWSNAIKLAITAITRWRFRKLEHSVRFGAWLVWIGLGT